MSETPVPYLSEEPEREPSRILYEDYSVAHGYVHAPTPFIRRRNLSADAKLLYLALLSYGWRDGACHPGKEALCEDLGVSPNTLKKAMKELIDKEIISVKRRGLGMRDQITVHALKPSDDDPKHDDQETQELADGNAESEPLIVKPRRFRSSNSDDLKPQDLNIPISTTSLSTTSLSTNQEVDGGGGSDFDFHERVKTVAAIFGITAPKDYAAIQRKVVAAEQEAAQLGAPLDTVEQARDCELWYSSRRRQVKSWPLTYGKWLHRTVHPQNGHAPTVERPTVVPRSIGTYDGRDRYRHLETTAKYRPLTEDEQHELEELAREIAV